MQPRFSSPLAVIACLRCSLKNPDTTEWRFQLGWRGSRKRRHHTVQDQAIDADGHALDRHETADPRNQPVGAPLLGLQSILRMLKEAGWHREG